jgi:hypothetical protein
MLRYNPEPGESVGRVIERDVLLDIIDDLNRRFSGHTLLGRLKVDDDGVDDPGGGWGSQVEPSVRIEVSVPPERVDEVRRYVKALGERLGQEAMYFIAFPPCAEIIPITKPGEGQRGVSNVD